jgi:hypothetical protein
MLYHSQLDSVVRGKGVRVMRRLTARSKFRAAQALFYIGHSRSPDVVTELGLHRSFLYCLCELQEIRLPCSEESLLDAMGLKVSDYKVARTDAAADPRALVRTWLHDEGAHTEVVELARDLLVVTGFQEAGIWHHLVGHMTARGFRRPLFETLQQIAATPVFVDLSFGMMAAEMLTALAAGLTEAIDRADQVIYSFGFNTAFKRIALLIRSFWYVLPGLELDGWATGRQGMAAPARIYRQCPW